jgi:hypothetical protein
MPVLMESLQDSRVISPSSCMRASPHPQVKDYVFCAHKLMADLQEKENQPELDFVGDNQKGNLRKD